MEQLHATVIYWLVVVVMIFLGVINGVVGLAAGGGRRWAWFLGAVLVAGGVPVILMGRAIGIVPIGTFLIGLFAAGRLKGWSDGIGVLLICGLGLALAAPAWSQSTSGGTPQSVADIAAQASAGITGWNASILSVGGTMMPVILTVAGILVVVGVVIRLASKI